MTNTFIVKINSNKCPEQIGRPKSLDVWEGGWFDIPSSATTPQGKQDGSPNPSPGDLV